MGLVSEGEGAEETQKEGHGSSASTQQTPDLESRKGSGTRKVDGRWTRALGTATNRAKESVMTLNKEKLNLERKKKQVCQAGWQEY